MKILMAVDGSAHSLKALETLLASVAWFRDAPVVDVIHVHAPIPYGAAAAWVGKDAVRHYYDEESDKALAPSLDRLAAAGIAHAPVKRVGDPAHEIVRHAKEGGYDLVAVGTHGHTALANVVMGSVATKVVASSTLPVLLLR
jgi:nucleotide-binding universal stress UspA family protein